METILSEIIKYASEAFSGHNDGWVTNHYKQELIKIRDYLNTLKLDEKDDV